LLLRRSQVFVHQRNIRADGFRSLAEGEPVEFEIREDSRSGKVRASHRQFARSPASASIASLTEADGQCVCCYLPQLGLG